MSITKFIDFQIFKNKKIIIDEQSKMSVDFFLRDLIPLLDNPSVFVYNDMSKCKYGNYRSDCTVKSEYNGDIYKDETILDNAYMGITIFNIRPNSQFCIFRDGTAKKSDWYDYDIVVLIEPLPSGICIEFDGVITIRNRYKIFSKLKYKTFPSKTEYYEI